MTPNGIPYGYTSRIFSPFDTPFGTMNHADWPSQSGWPTQGIPNHPNPLKQTMHNFPVDPHFWIFLDSQLPMMFDA